MYLIDIISYQFHELKRYVNVRFSRTSAMIIVSILSVSAALLQSMGTWMPGIGYILSSFSTAPIVFSSLFSLRYSVLSYFLTILLLLILQPSELFVFPFTTGILGLGLAIGYHCLHRRIAIVPLCIFTLTIGTLFVLYVFNFPVLGTDTGTTLNNTMFFSMLLFYVIYSWLWVELIRVLIRRIYKMTKRNINIS